MSRPPDATAANASVARSFYELAYNAKDLTLLDEFFAPGVVVHTPGADEAITGVESLRSFLAGIQAGFPDAAITIEELLAFEDRVVARLTMAGTHLGAYRGIPPTGRSFRISQIQVLRVHDGRIVELWQEIDALGLLRQLGTAPPEGVGPTGLLAWTVSTIARFAALSLRSRLRRRR